MQVPTLTLSDWFSVILSADKKFSTPEIHCFGLFAVYLLSLFRLCIASQENIPGVTANYLTHLRPSVNVPFLFWS
tara:strand:+ start:1085 stop:1309 length:225 start_codon:yes stop_codon:yes gene_type:complete